MNPSPQADRLTTSVVIPARMSSTRLPGKVLLDLNGWPVLRHVWERVRRMRLADEIFIATDDAKVRHQAESWGARVVMTSPDCQSGTERIASVLDQFTGELILNVQGDEPLIDPLLLDQLVERASHTQADLVTAVAPIDTTQELFSPNRVKVIRGLDGKAIYFSRSPIPYLRGIDDHAWIDSATTFWAHIGVYGYRRHILATYPSLPSSPLETAESLEQLRFVDAGYHFQTVVTDYNPIAIDTPEDLEKARTSIAPI